MKLLLIEDSHRLRKSLSLGLQKLGFTVDAAEEGSEGLQLANSRLYDIIILDLMLPAIDGLSILREIKRRKVPSGVLILSAKGELEDRVKGLNSGADDYLCKPFAFTELHARINSIARKRFQLSSNLIAVEESTLDIELKVFKVNSREIPLTPLEYKILEYLAFNRGRILTYQNFEDHLYCREAIPSKNTIEVHISALRKKLRTAGSRILIKTRRGFGYYLDQA